MGTAELGLGIMRFQINSELGQKDMMDTIDEYMKGNVCYFDVHPAYANGNAQSIFKNFVVDRYPRNRFLVANKMPYYGISGYEDYEKIFESELIACGLEFFDYYMIHAVTKSVYEMHQKNGLFEYLLNLKMQGKIGKLGISYHDSPEFLQEILNQHKEIEFVQLQINFLDWEDPIIRSKQCYEIARNNNKEILVMEPIKGGTLAKQLVVDNKVISSEKMADISLKFVNGLQGISYILSGMIKKEQVISNRKSLIEDDVDNDYFYKKLIKIINSQNLIKCTGCGYCLRECVKNIPIPNILKLLNDYNVNNDGNMFGSESVYRAVVEGKGKASECVSCKKCQKHCPQGLLISQYMKEANVMFESKKNCFYSSERNTLIIVSLLKEYGINKIVVSPGATNISFVQSVQYDDFFEIYSAPDERSAAYMAVGMAEESGEPVVLSCTGATASRNYIPALTEAYYRKIPVLAITSSQPRGRIGHNFPQMIDRTSLLNDIAKISVEMDIIKDGEDEWSCVVAANRALIELTDIDKGPVHINLITEYSKNFSVIELPKVRTMKLIRNFDNFETVKTKKIAIFSGIHSKWDEDSIHSVEKFCEEYNAILLQDHTGNYAGRYAISTSILFSQENKYSLCEWDILIHIGNVSGAYYPLKAKEVWRVNPDGKVCDTFKKLTKIFAMDERVFFEGAVRENIFEVEDNYGGIEKWQDEERKLLSQNIQLPFSNILLAKLTSSKLPQESVLHLGILNSLRSWNMFKMPNSVNVYANTGGFGIDGCVSTLIGASLVNPNKLYYGVVGDLAFFYDMNSLGNRHVGNNLRLIVVNNGCGAEFVNYDHLASELGERRKVNIAASGHYGNKSINLIKNYVESLGFEYISASNENEYLSHLDYFLNNEITSKSIIFEVFTEDEDESKALYIMNNLHDKQPLQSHVNNRKSCYTCFTKSTDYSDIVIWGTGNCFWNNITKIQRYINVLFACDNAQEKWGKEIIPGIRCISPDELKKLENPFIIIMVDDLRYGFQIANQLQKIDIFNYDIYSNWLSFMEE